MNFSNIYFGRYFAYSTISSKFLREDLSQPYLSTFKFKEYDAAINSCVVLGFGVSSTSFASSFRFSDTSFVNTSFFSKKFSFFYRSDKIAFPFTLRFAGQNVHYDISWYVLTLSVNFQPYEGKVLSFVKSYFVFLFLLKSRKLYFVSQKLLVILK